MCKLAAILTLLLGASAFAAWGDPVDVTFVVTGTPGDYTIEFTVANNLLSAPDQDLYFFGVMMPDRDIVSSPGSYDPDAWIAWDNVPYGGSATVYNNNWIGGGGLLPGTTLDGFIIHSTELVAPTSIPFFAYGSGSAAWLEGGNFNTTTNPGFEGLAVTAVPEPSSLALLATGAAALAYRRRRRTPVA